MVRRVVALGLAVFILGVADGNAHVARGQDALFFKLQELDQMRNGRDTPMEKVEGRGKELLAEYTKAEEQGRIQYQLALVWSQSGMVHPELTIAHARRALQLSLRPEQRLELYVYWGDSLRFLDKKTKPAVEIRKAAAVAYLEGLNEALKYQAPEHPPQLPGVGKFDAPKGSLAYERLSKIHDEQVAARERAETGRWLSDNRRVLTTQIVDIYALKPYAPAELREIATPILGDPAEVDRLLKLVDEKIKERAKPLPRNPNAPKRPPPPVEHTWRLTAVIGSLIGIGVLVVILWLRHRRRQASPLP